MKFVPALILFSAFSSLAIDNSNGKTTLIVERISLGFSQGTFAIEGLQHASVQEHFDMEALITIREDDAEYYCQPRGEWIPSLPVYDECELLKLDPGSRAAVDRNKWRGGPNGGSGSTNVRPEYTNNSPGKLFFTVMPPFPGKQRWQPYLDEPLKMRLLYENAQGTYLTTDVVIWEAELVNNAADPSGGNYQYATIMPFIYRMLPVDTTKY